MSNAIEFRHLKGADITPWLPQLAGLRIRVFREFPYLYDGSEDYERTYLQTYVESDTSIAVLALDGERVVGASTGLALVDEEDDFVKPFADAGYDIDSLFYCAESVLLPEYRGRGLYKHFFDAREAHALTLPKTRLITFCAVERPENHPRRPPDYVPLDAVWRRFGYRRREDLRTTFEWQDLDEPSSTSKPMVYYLKRIGQD